MQQVRVLDDHHHQQYAVAHPSAAGVARDGASSAIEPTAIASTAIDPTLFAAWSERLAWLVGLIWCDGTVTGRTIRLFLEDAADAAAVQRVLQGGRQTHQSPSGRVRLSLSSKVGVARLREWGFASGAASNGGGVRGGNIAVADIGGARMDGGGTDPVWPPVPDAFLPDFMRGLFDGAGTVMLRQARPGQQAPELRVAFATVAPAIGDGVARWLATQAISCTDMVRTSSASFARRPRRSIQIVQHDALRRLYDLLYYHDMVACLPRKRAVFEQWLATPRPRRGRPRTRPRTPDGRIIKDTVSTNDAAAAATVLGENRTACATTTRDERSS